MQALEQGTHREGYAELTLEGAIESFPLSLGTSAQLAELITLTMALKLSKDMGLNIYTDSKCACLVLLSHAAPLNGRHFLTANGFPVIHYQVIDSPLFSVLLPQVVVAIHYKGQQKGVDEIAKGN